MSDTIAEPIAAEDAPVTEDVTDAVAADAAARGWRSWSTKTLGSATEVC